jgi:hypothetical protein
MNSRNVIDNIPRRHQYQLFEIEKERLLNLCEDAAPNSSKATANRRPAIRYSGRPKQTARKSYATRAEKVSSVASESRYSPYPAQKLFGGAQHQSSWSSPKPMQSERNHLNFKELNEFQQHLKLLEEQNQKRFYLARNEHHLVQCQHQPYEQQQSNVYGYNFTPSRPEVDGQQPNNQVFGLQGQESSIMPGSIPELNFSSTLAPIRHGISMAQNEIPTTIHAKDLNNNITHSHQQSWNPNHTGAMPVQQAMPYNRTSKF